MTKDDPKGYFPYRELTFCSNSLFGGVRPFQIGQQFPVLIGKGEDGPPLVWLRAPENSESVDLVEIARASVPTHPAVHVSRDDHAILFLAGGEKVLNVVELSPAKAIVDFVDLRTIGFDIFGDTSSLNAGGHYFSRNTINGGTSFIAFDIEPVEPPNPRTLVAARAEHAVGA